MSLFTSLKDNPPTRGLATFALTETANVLSGTVVDDGGGGGTVTQVAGGTIAGLVAWIGALLDTWGRESRAWFVGLLLLGIFNLGFVAMVAYLVAGPSEPSEPVRRDTPSAIPA